MPFFDDITVNINACTYIGLSELPKYAPTVAVITQRVWYNCGGLGYIWKHYPSRSKLKGAAACTVATDVASAVDEYTSSILYIVGRLTVV